MKAIIITYILVLTTIVAYPQSRSNRSGSNENRSNNQRTSTSQGREVKKSGGHSSDRINNPNTNVNQNVRSGRESSYQGGGRTQNNQRTSQVDRKENNSSNSRNSNSENNNSRGGGNSNGQGNRGSNSGYSGGNNYDRSVSRDHNSSNNKVHHDNGNHNGHYNKVVVKEKHYYHSEPRVREVRVYRHIAPPRPLVERRVTFAYRSPVQVNIVWTNTMYNDYVAWYPHYHRWNYPVGYRIPTISAYDAILYPGDVRRVYGQVHEVYYSAREDDYYLYFGAPYPYQDFSVVIPGYEARRFDVWPERFFEGRSVTVTGLITLFEDKPEIIVKRNHQISIY